LPVTGNNQSVTLSGAKNLTSAGKLYIIEPDFFTSFKRAFFAPLSMTAFLFTKLITLIQKDITMLSFTFKLPPGF